MNPNLSHNQDHAISIDGFSLTYALSDPESVRTICDRLIDLNEDDQFNGSTIRRGDRYQYRFSIPLPINDPVPTGSLVIEAGARFPGIADLRIDFKPVKTGPNGILDVIALLDLITPAGGEHIITNGTFTRYDIAIDIWGQSVDEVLVFSKRSQKHGVYTNRKGIPETVYMGTVRSDRTVAYSKIHKSTGKSSLRIERRMRRRCKGHDLPHMLDPFRVVQLVHTRLLMPALDGLVPQMFFDSVRLRGLNRVLPALSLVQRRTIKAVLNDPAKSLLPSTAQIWTGWCHLLENSGLGFLITDRSVGAPLIPDQMTSADERAVGT
jgi:hypothetical protein